MRALTHARTPLIREASYTGLIQLYGKLKRANIRSSGRRVGKWHRHHRQHGSVPCSAELSEKVEPTPHPADGRTNRQRPKAQQRNHAGTANQLGFDRKRTQRYRIRSSIYVDIILHMEKGPEGKSTTFSDAPALNCRSWYILPPPVIILLYR